MSKKGTSSGNWIQHIRIKWDPPPVLWRTTETDIHNQKLNWAKMFWGRLGICGLICFLFSLRNFVAVCFLLFCFALINEVILYTKSYFCFSCQQKVYTSTQWPGQDKLKFRQASFQSEYLSSRIVSFYLPIQWDRRSWSKRSTEPRPASLWFPSAPAANQVRASWHPGCTGTSHTTTPSSFQWPPPTDKLPSPVEQRHWEINHNWQKERNLWTCL